MNNVHIFTLFSIYSNSNSNSAILLNVIFYSICNVISSLLTSDCRSSKLQWTLADWDQGKDQEAKGTPATLDLQVLIDFVNFGKFKEFLEWSSLT